MAAAGIVAGGSGQRMGTELPKQFIELAGKPVIIRTVEAFALHPDIECVIIGINPDWYDYTQKLVKQYSLSKNVYITNGGKDRNDTIMNIISFAKKELSKDDSEIILTHDAVRPFVSSKMINDSIDAMKKYHICTTAIPATDTIIISEDGEFASNFPARKNMYQVQTPQTFRIGDFEKVYMGLSTQEKEEITENICTFAKNLNIRNNEKTKYEDKHDSEDGHHGRGSTDRGIVQPKEIQRGRKHHGGARLHALF